MDNTYAKNTDLEIVHALINILQERGGIVEITQDDWNIYDEVARRLNISFEEQTRSTRGGEAAWRTRVGWAKKVLKNERMMTDLPGARGTWILLKGHSRGLVALMTKKS